MALKNFFPAYRGLSSIVILAILFLNTAHAEIISVAPYQAYLNKLGSLQAKFVQRDGSGRQSRGNLYLKKPGKMRLDYDDQPLELVADGTWFVQNDRELEESYHVLLSSTPAAFAAGGCTRAVRRSCRSGSTSPA